MTTNESAPVAVTAGELLPCPFCGGEARLLSGTSSIVRCQNDQCIIGDPAPFNDFSHRQDAVWAWNTRAALAQPPVAVTAWTCFHCGDTFTDKRCARLHFGRDEDSTPACIIKAGAEQGLLGALREAEYEARDARQAIANESTESARYHYAQATRHIAALRNAEEAGYERGLADAAALALQSPPAAKVEADWMQMARDAAAAVRPNSPWAKSVLRGVRDDEPEVRAAMNAIAEVNALQPAAQGDAAGPSDA